MTQGSRIPHAPQGPLAPRAARMPDARPTRIPHAPGIAPQGEATAASPMLASGATRRASWAQAQPAPSTLRPHAVDAHLVNDEEREALSGAVVHVDLGAVRTNYRLAMDLVGPDVKPSAVIKANGYGLDAGVLAKTLIEEGCRDFFVARPVEAYDLRKTLADKVPGVADKVSVIVLDGLTANLDPKVLVDNRITPVLNTAEQVKRWNAKGAELGCKLPAILQVDSGMSRAGLSPDQLDEVLANGGQALEHIDLRYVMSHLANAGGFVTDDDTFKGHAEFRAGPDSEKQRQSFETQFERIRQVAPDTKACLGASSTVFLGAEYHKDMIRLGGTFHGQAPISTEGNPYAPVMGLTTRINEVRTIPKNTGVGYGLSFKAKEDDTKVATLSIGYADGIPRHPGGPDVKENGPYVLVHGPDGSRHKAPVIGKTSMDMLAVDVTKVPDEALKEGGTVTLIGDGITTDHHGDMYGTNASETQVKLTERVHVKYSDDEERPAVDTGRSSTVQSAWRGVPSRG